MAVTRYDDWLTEYLYFTSGHEIPTLYNQWTGILLIAAVLKQHVYLDMGTYKLYPNMFIIIIDEASAGKSHAIEKFGLNLLTRADEKDASDNKLYVYNQQINAAAMIKSMSELYKDKGENCVTVVAEELGFFTDMSGDNMNISNVLIKTYDNGNLPKQTIARSLEAIPNAQINILGGTTPRSLKDSINNKYIKEGVLQRMIFIHSEELSNPKPFPIPPRGNDMRKEYLADDLNDFKTLRGKFRWDAEAISYYEKWYCKTWENFEERKDKISVKRMANKMLKIAMILSVARKHNLILELSDIIDAIRIRNESLNNYLYIDTKLTTSEFGTKVQSILDIIKVNKKMKHSELMKKVYHWLQGTEFNSAINTLVEADLIEVETVRTKNATKPTKIYIWRG